ncbi:MAG: glycosyltransferase family 4 protein [Lachnospiraceae bacterium]|nr:glycosyltransferase family 4 protein [Lachnospiraceae bacterium]
MKVLWVCNIMLPAIAQALSEEYSVREGWLSGILGRVLETADGEAQKEETVEYDRKEQIQKAAGNLELGICFPGKSGADLSVRLPLGTKKKEVACYSFYEDLTSPENYDDRMEARFAQILADFKPDLVHIFGTEFGHAYACAKVWNKPEKTLLGIQGLCGSIAEHYYADLPQSVINSVTLRDFLKKDSIRQQQKKFEKRAQTEKKTISLAGHITGRTAFDQAETNKINPGAQYHAMNETMRSGFYEGSWSLTDCRRHEIFVSQADYPLKGFHYLLQAMPAVLGKYPDAQIKVAGNSILGTGGFKSRLKLPAYGKYLRRLIRQYGLEGHVTVLGRMQEEQMKQEYLSAHLFVCPSAVENSPNSVAEAQLLGVPVAAARTGGIPSVVKHEQSGLLFDKGNSQQLAEAVLRIFGDDAFAEELSETEKGLAHSQYDGDVNFRRLLEIYGEIA